MEIFFYFYFLGYALYHTSIQLWMYVDIIYVYPDSELPLLIYMFFGSVNLGLFEQYIYIYMVHSYNRTPLWLWRTRIIKIMCVHCFRL